MHDLVSSGMAIVSPQFSTVSGVAGILVEVFFFFLLLFPLGFVIFFLFLFFSFFWGSILKKQTKTMTNSNGKRNRGYSVDQGFASTPIALE